MASNKTRNSVKSTKTQKKASRVKKTKISTEAKMIKELYKNFNIKGRDERIVRPDIEEDIITDTSNHPILMQEPYNHAEDAAKEVKAALNPILNNHWRICEPVPEAPKVKPDHKLPPRAPAVNGKNHLQIKLDDLHQSLKDIIGVYLASNQYDDVIKLSAWANELERMNIKAATMVAGGAFTRPLPTMRSWECRKSVPMGDAF